MLMKHKMKRSLVSLNKNKLTHSSTFFTKIHLRNRPTTNFNMRAKTKHMSISNHSKSFLPKSIVSLNCVLTKSAANISTIKCKESKGKVKNEGRFI